MTPADAKLIADIRRWTDGMAAHGEVRMTVADLRALADFTVEADAARESLDCGLTDAERRASPGHCQASRDGTACALCRVAMYAERDVPALTRRAEAAEAREQRLRAALVYVERKLTDPEIEAETTDAWRRTQAALAEPADTSALDTTYRCARCGTRLPCEAGFCVAHADEELVALAALRASDRQALEAAQARAEVLCEHYGHGPDCGHEQKEPTP